MTNRMNQNEKPSIIQFPNNGVVAVDIPTKSINVSPKNGRLEPKDAGVRELSGELNNSSNQVIRSMTIFSSLDVKIKGIYEDEIYLQSGWNTIEGIPETDSFTLDFDFSDTANNQPIEPDEVFLSVYMFNTEYAQYEPNSGLSGSIDKEMDVTKTSYETAMIVPAKAFDNERFKVENPDGNGIDARLSTIDAGNETTEAEVTGIIEFEPFDSLPTAEFYKLEVKKNTATDTNAKITFIGGSN